MRAGKKLVARGVGEVRRLLRPARTGFYDYPDLGRVADYVFVMNWG